MATTTNVQKPKTTRELLNEAQSVAAQNYREGKINTPFGYIFARDAAFIYSELDKLGVTDPSKLQAKVVGTGDNEKVQYINGTTGKVIQEKPTSQGGSLDLGGNRDVNGYDLFMTPNASGGLTLASTPPPKSSWVKFRDNVLKPAAVIGGVYFGAPYLLEALGLSTGAGAGVVGADLAANAVAGVEGVASQAGLTAYNSAIANGLSIADAAALADRAVSSTAALLEAGFSEAEALKTSLDNLGVQSSFRVGDTGLLQDAANVVSGLPKSALVTGGLLAANAVSSALQPRQTTDAAGNVTYNLPPQMQFQGREYTPATGNLYRYGFGPEQAMFQGKGPTSTIGRTSVTPGVTQVAAPAAGSPLATQSLAQQGMTPSGLLAANVNGQQVPIVQPVDQATVGLLNQGVQVTQPQALTRDLAATIFQGFFDRAPTEQEIATFAQYGDRFKTPAEFSTFLMNSPQYQAYRDSLLAARNQPVAPAGGGTTQTVVQQAGGGSPTIVNAPMDMGLLSNESVVSGAGAPAFSGGLFTAMPTTNYITNDQAIDVFKSLTGYAPTQEQVAAFSGANTFTSPDAFRAFLTGTPDYQFMAAQGMLPSMNGLLQTR